MPEEAYVFPQGCRYIAGSERAQSPVFRRKFVLHGRSPARIAVTALGFFELWLNGVRVGEELYRQAWSDYAPRPLKTLLYPLADEMSHSVYVCEYDVTELLAEGENTLTFLLGNGWYRQTERNVEGELSYGSCLGVRYCLTAGEEVFVSDGSEEWREGHIPFNNIYFGETQDLSIPLPCAEAEGWLPVRTLPPPAAAVRLQRCRCDRVIRSISCRQVSETVWDAGENLSGFVELCSAGEGEIAVRYAEERSAGGGLDYHSAGGEEQIGTDRYRHVRKGQRLAPVFACHGFRYVCVEGKVSSVTAKFVSCAEQTAAFSSSDARLNELFAAYMRTQLANLHYGVPTDCPHRERLGYTGDGQLVADAALLMTSSRPLFEKWMQDIADCQDVRTGHVQHTAPFYGGGGGPGGWGSAIVVLPYRHMQHFADRAFVRRYYPNCLRWAESMRGFTEGGLIVRERAGGWCLGDWCTPEPIALPEAYVNTCLYVRALTMLEELARFIGERACFAAEIAAAKAALRAHFYDAAANTFCGGVQGADLFAAAIGLADEAMRRRLVRFYEARGRADTGIFGTDLLFDFLAKEGRADLVYTLFTAEAYPSFGYMFRHGATTLWEEWNGQSSHAHPMFGACVKHLFYTLLGVTQEGYGFTDLVLRPPACLPARIEGSLAFAWGRLSVSYTRQGGGLLVRAAAQGARSVRIAWQGKQFPLPPEGELFLPDGDAV